MKTDIFETLKFTNEWRELGIISDDVLASLETKWLSGEDPNTEHYRWKAFVDFMEQHPSLEHEVLRRVYSLGQFDHDSSMGGAMMVAILNRKECPRDLIYLASESSEKFLRGVADRKIQAFNKQK